jgi:GNAT superfamily N-acetyltransferase
MGKYKIIGICENEEYLTRAVDYFASKWNIDRRIYEDCIGNSLSSESLLPKWYLMLDENEIIGGYGLILNDFISRQDLFPWFCALHIEKEYRGKKLGEKLLKHGRMEAFKLGYTRLYLCTDLYEYYEKYGWKYLANGFHPWGEESRIYETYTVQN